MKKSFILLFLTLTFNCFYSSPMNLPGPEEGKVKNIILMIGDGMGLSQITAGMIVNGNKLSLERCKHIGLSKTFSYKNIITDSSAGATAMACGRKTYNGAVAIDPEKQLPLPTILEIAHQNNRSTGLVVTSHIQHATPACFYAHQPERYMYKAITTDFLSGVVDIAIGGGSKYFEERDDAKEVAATLKKLGYEYFTKLKKAKKKSVGNRLLILEAEDRLPPVSSGRGKFLQEGAEFAIEKLNNSGKEGFFLLIEGSQIDWGGHANDKDYVVSELIDFDNTIGKVLDFAEQDKNTLVIITADHETGGLAVEGGSFKNKSVTTDFTSGGHTATMVPVFAFGPGAENFSGIYENTSIFFKMMEAFGFTPK